MTDTTQGPYLVSGASGQLGQLVLDELLDQDCDNVIATTRSPDDLFEYEARGVEVRRADFMAPETLETAFAGARRMLLISTSDLEPGARLRSHLAAIDAAVAAGVEHIVYTSLTNPHEDSPISFAADHRKTEDKLAQLSISHTVLRNNLYTDLLLMSGPQAVATGRLVGAGADGRVGYVTRADCATAAAAALLHERSSSTYDITGPSLVSMTGVARLLSETTGKPVQHVSVTPTDVERGMIDHGVPAAMARMLASIDEGIAQGELAVSSPDFAELTGAAPMSVEEFLRLHANTLRGEAS